MRALSSEERAAAAGKRGKIKCENERLRICSEKDCGSSERYILSMVIVTHCKPKLSGTLRGKRIKVSTQEKKAKKTL